MNNEQLKISNDEIYRRINMRNKSRFERLKNNLLVLTLLIAHCSLLIVACDNLAMTEILPDRSIVNNTDSDGSNGNGGNGGNGGNDNGNGHNVGGDIIIGYEFTLKLDPKNMEAGDNISFADSFSLTEINALNGSDISIYYTLADTNVTNELTFSIGPATPTGHITNPGTGVFTYTVNYRDSVNDVITITADFIHSHLIILNPPENVHFDQSGNIIFDPGANNAAAGCIYTYTLYRNSTAVLLDEPYENIIPSVIVSEMLSLEGFYTVKVKAHTSNPDYTSLSIESAPSEAVIVYHITLQLSNKETSEKVFVTVNGVETEYTVPIYVFAGTNIILRATPDANRIVTWNGISGNIFTIDDIKENTQIFVTFSSSEITLYEPSAVTYSNNHKNRNALTPIPGEHTATFTVTVGGFVNGIDARNVELAISPVAPGLTITGHNAKTDALNGIKNFTVQITYDGTTRFDTSTYSPQITPNTSTIPHGYTYSSASNFTRNINIIDGQIESRAIPVTQNNIDRFNTHAGSATAREGKFYKQIEDITLTHNWTTIGNASNHFNSTYDGGNFTISNLTNTGAFNGLFNTIGTSGTVKNLGVEGKITIGGGTIGSIAGTNNGTISNCYSNVTYTSLNNYSGGIVGRNNGIIRNCYNAGNITGHEWIAGIAGSNTGVIENCINTGTITANGLVGGIVATNTSIVRYCYNTGDILSGNGSGGITGHNNVEGSDTNNSVSLGRIATGYIASPTASNVGRVLGFFNAASTMYNLKTREDMITMNRNTSTAFVFTATGSATRHGENIAVDGSVPLSSVFSGWDTTIWNIPPGNLIIGGALPMLQNMPGGAQEPKLP